MNKSNLHPHAWSRLAAFDKLKPAQALVEFLEEHWFVVRLYDERKLQRFWFLARPIAGICVQVPEESAAAVRDFLATQPAGDELLRTAIHCPSCESLHVQYPQMTRKNVLPTLVAHGMITLGLMQHECYCEDCHFTWVRGTSGTSVKRSPNIPLFATRNESSRSR